MRYYARYPIEVNRYIELRLYVLVYYADVAPIPMELYIYSSFEYLLTTRDNY